MTSESQNKLLARRLLEEVVNSGDVERLPEFLAPDFVAPAFGMAGIEGFREHLLMFHRCYPDLVATVEGQVAEGDTVVTWWTMRGTHLGEFGGVPPTGKPITLRGVNVQKIRDGRIVEHSGGSNSLEALLELGIVQWAGNATATHDQPTKLKINIRSETEADASAITEVTIAAFKTLEISRHTEQFIIAALRLAKALTISLVAELDGRVIGHVAFSPVTISDGTRNWYGLGPVSVLPDYQRQGVGQALIREGLSRLKAIHAKGCCLVGHPDYYRKFGFRNVPGFVHEGVPPDVFFALSFDGRTPQGTVAFHEAFKADGASAGDALRRA